MEAINDFSVSEGSFWHINMDLYYGYHQGEVVEVEHESNKYWLATVEYSFKHLILLKWIGNYGEFWVDTSSTNLTSTISSTTFNEFNSTPRRLFPPGYHLQSQLKSQFTLERPTKVLVKPSLYNPANDPYAEIRNVDELLAHEIEHAASNDYGSQASATDHEAASLAMAKTKIAFGQDDVDELEAALQNLNEIDGLEPRAASPVSFNISSNNKQISKEDDTEEQCSSIKSEQNPDILTTTSSGDGKPCEAIPDDTAFSSTVTNQTKSHSKSSTTCCDDSKPESTLDHEKYLQMCKTIQTSAMNMGKYFGIEENKNTIYFLKPKQFFDLGGANHEKVLVPGTLLEIYHSKDEESGVNIFHWLAVVIKNVGGRLILRWFLCDDPKFKQGRLELKSCRSELIREEEEGEDDPETLDEDEKSEGDEKSKTKLSAKDITFSMHFCDPRVHTLSQGQVRDRIYQMPDKLFSYLVGVKGNDEAMAIEEAQFLHVFDTRRLNLDKDRPIIDHLLSTVRWMRPSYVNLFYAPKDKDSRREVLISTPKLTKLFKGYVKREVEPGVYEINSEPISETGEVIKFIFPYDSSYSLLPTNWAISNEDCLSVHPSRNPSPTPTYQTPSSDNSINKSTCPTTEENDDSNKIEPALHNKQDDQPPSNYLSHLKPIYEPMTTAPFTLLCEVARTHCLREERTILQNNMELFDRKDFNEQDPIAWSKMMRTHELNAPEFQCHINCSSKEAILSKFKVMDQLEVVHPSSDVTICLGRIRKIVYPLLWIQISADCYTVLPFNSTDIFPTRWCEINNHPLISILPPRKRLNQPSSQLTDKKRKKTKNDDDLELDQEVVEYEKEHFDLGSLDDKQMDIDYILNEKSMYITIYFNHKCFTGPSLSKGKICSLPQYVGPGPFRLVMEEVVTKVISVAYVPPRILNDLSSKSFEDLLKARNMTNTGPIEFKAKYQKRVHREVIPVCLNPDDVTLYCECICEHLKCCYNLFGPNLYDGDDCPGHCRVLTKSNKFMKRATYYREKARLGEFINNDNGNSKKSTNSSSNNKTSRARYAGRDSSESTSSSISRSEQLNSRASSAGDDLISTTDLKENLVAVEEIENEEESKEDDVNNGCNRLNQKDQTQSQSGEQDVIVSDGNVGPIPEPEVDTILFPTEQEQNVNSVLTLKPSPKCENEPEFSLFDVQNTSSPDDWTVDDVSERLEWCHLTKFKSHMVSEVSMRIQFG